MLVEFSYISDLILLKAVLGLMGVERLMVWDSSMPWSFLGRWFEISSTSRVFHLQHMKFILGY